MSLMRVRVESARSPDFPEGSTSHGYEFVAPLKSDGHIDASECHVVRFWGDVPEEEGLLHSGTRGWRFDNEKADDTDDHASLSLDTQMVAPGAFISIAGHDGKQQPFRVLMMIPWGKTFMSNSNL